MRPELGGDRWIEFSGMRPRESRSVFPLIGRLVRDVTFERFRFSRSGLSSRASTSATVVASRQVFLGSVCVAFVSSRRGADKESDRLDGTCPPIVEQMHRIKERWSVRCRGGRTRRLIFIGDTIVRPRSRCHASLCFLNERLMAIDVNRSEP